MCLESPLEIIVLRNSEKLFLIDFSFGILLSIFKYEIRRIELKSSSFTKNVAI